MHVNLGLYHPEKYKILPPKQCYKKFLGSPNKNSIFLRPTSITEVGTIILSLKDGKATGPNDIPLQKS